MGRLFRRRMVRAALAAAVATTLHASIVQADTSWSSSISGMWTDGFKWTAGVPGSSTDAAVKADTINHDFYVITLNTSGNAHSLSLNAPGGAIAIQGNNFLGNALLTVTNGFTLTNGFLGLQSLDGGWNSDLDVTGGGMTIETGGSMFLTRGTYGGQRNITGNVVNRGFIYSDGAALLNSGTLTNYGSLQVDAFGQFIVNSTATYRNLAGATLSANASSQFVINGGTFDWSGGSVSGPIYMAGSNPTLKTSVSGLNNNSFSSIFHFRTSGHLSGDLSAGAMAVVEGNNVIGNVLLDVDSGATNRGRIQLESTDGGWEAKLRISSGTFTNAGQLWITTSHGAGIRTVSGNLYNTGETLISGDTDFNGNVHNSGNFLVNSGNAKINSSMFVQDGGTLSVGQSTGGYMLVNNGTFLYLGGTIAGEVELRENSYLATSVLDGHGAKFLASRSGVTLSGGLAPATTLRVMGNNLVGSVVLNSVGDGSNSGTINLESADGGWESNLTVESGKTLTNHGTILASAGAGGFRRLKGVIDNEFGIFDRSTPGYGTYIDGQLSNFNLYYIGANSTTHVISTSTFVQGGFQLSMEPGARMLIDGGTFSYGGGSITGSGEINLYNAHLRTTLANGSGAAFNVMTDSHLESNLSPNTNVNVIGNNTFGSTNFIVPNGAQLRGIIHLTTTGGGWTSQLQIPNDLATANTGSATNSGTILFETGAGGGRSIQGYITNKGMVQANISGDIYGSFYNKPGGTFKIADNQTVTLHQVALAGDIFSQEGGTLILGANSHLNMAGTSFIFDSGTLTLGTSMIAKTASVPTGSSISAAGLSAGLSVTDPSGITIPGGSIISSDGASIVAQGGGNIVAQGGGNIVAQGAGNIVAQGAGNILISDLASLISNDGGSFRGNAIVAQGAGNIVAQGAGNIVAQGAGNALPLAVPVSLGGPTPNPGDIFIDSSTFTINGGIASAAAATRILNGSRLTGNGTITAGNFEIDGNSTLSVIGGTLHLFATANAYNAGTLATGHWQVHANSTLDAPSIGTITTNAADVTLDGANSIWTSTDSLTTNLGRLAITGGRTFTAQGTFTNNGSLAIGDTSALKVPHSLANAGTIDLNGALIVDYDPAQSGVLDQLRSQIGNRITSSHHASDGHFQIGYCEASDLGISTIDGLPVDSTSAIVELTFSGDANLDGKVDITDLYRLASAWQSSGAVWMTGDFTYDGQVNAADLQQLASNWQAGVASPASAASLSPILASLGLPEAAVPEPTGAAVLSLAACGFLTGRRSRK